MSQVTQELKAARKKAGEDATRIQAIWDKAKDDDARDLTDEESAEVLELTKSVNTIKDRITELEEKKATEDDIKRISREMGPPSDDSQLHKISIPPQQHSIGQMFVESEAFKSFQEGRADRATVELDTKGTLLTGTSSPGSGTGGGLLTVPQVAPGVVEKLFQRTTVADIIPSGPTSGNTIRYVVEGTATSGAAGVAEGGTKPESTLGLSTLDEPVKKIATVLPASDEMLEDAPQVEAYINRRLSLFVRIEEERQLVRGAGGNDLTGITGRSGVNTYGGTVDNNAIQIFKALNGTRGSSFLEPDYIIMNPANWQTTRLLMDSNNQFYGGGPFTGAYGNGGIPGNIESGQLAPPSDSLWGKPVIVTTAIGAGTALLGSFGAAAMVYRRSGITVEATNSHASYFTANLVAIRAELRLALCVFRPAAFTVVSDLD